jgi:hypothetical protein
VTRKLPVLLPLTQISKNVIFVSFFFYKIGEQGGKTGLVGDGEAGISRRGEVVEKVVRRVNMVQKLCAHVCKCKNDTY